MTPEQRAKLESALKSAKRAHKIVERVHNELWMQFKEECSIESTRVHMTRQEVDFTRKAEMDLSAGAVNIGLALEVE
ncbi:MAG: hypothetical protein WC359_13485 [Dehalococcoidia bacterium]|jgi:hypothetical protein